MERARFNMIEQQIRPWDVLDPAVLDVMRKVPREAFVDKGKTRLAYADIEVPIGQGESMMFPRVEGRMLQSLNISPEDRCLEVGTGSGYVTACMAHLSEHVHSIERHEEFVDFSGERLLQQHIGNVKLEVGDVFDGFAPSESYDVIAVTGAVADSPVFFEKMLKPGGRLFVVIGTAPVMEATLIVRESKSEFTRACLFETELKYLEGAQAKAAFVL